MRNFILLCFFLFVSVVVLGQELHHQMISAQGGSKKLKTGHYVSQTIGQQSIVGSRFDAGYAIIQGFQQSVWRKLMDETTLTEQQTITVYPNPVKETVNFQFGGTILAGPMQILLFDTLGRLVSQSKATIEDNKVRMTLNFLAPGMYLVQLRQKERTYYTKLLKID